MLKYYNKYQYDIPERPSKYLNILPNFLNILNVGFSNFNFNNQQLVDFLLCAGHCASLTSKWL